MAIPDKIIDEIQNKTDIVEVISHYTPLKKLGRNYKALCPFHHEKTPSFVVSPDKQIYHCFGCGAGGNVFSFVMRHENIEFPEAVEMLAAKAGVNLPRVTGQTREMASLANQLYRINELAAGFFSESLANNGEAKEYLRSRGISDESIRLFKVGYAPDAWERLIHFFKEKRIDAALLEKAGLAIKNEKGGYYDRFRKRIIFPISDLKNRVLGFGARVLDSSLPKYINSPETYIYSKGKNLYGLNASKEGIKKEGHVLIVEGYLDFLIPYQAGAKNIVATLGTALTVDQARLLKRFAQTVIMIYDPDEAGEAASLRNLDIFVSEEFGVYIAELPAGFDPDSFIRKFGMEDFARLIKSSKNLFDYKYDKLASRFDSRTAHGKARIANEMLPTIGRINNAVLRSNLVKRLAENLSVEEEAIREELKKVKLDYTYEIHPEPVSVERKDQKTAEKMLLGLVLEEKSFVEKVKEHLRLDEFKDSSIRDAMDAVFALHGENKEINPARLISHFENKGEMASLVSEVAGLSETVADREKAVSDCITKIKKDNIKDRLDRLQTAIKAAYDSKDDEKVKELVVEYDGLIKTS